jgi:hypothetical protein
VGNLSDRTFLSRLDFSFVVLTYLTFQIYGQFHYGKPGGELRFTLPSSIPAPPVLQEIGFKAIPDPFTTPTPLFDVGLGLRVNL